MDWDETFTIIDGFYSLINLILIMNLIICIVFLYVLITHVMGIPFIEKKFNYYYSTKRHSLLFYNFRKPFG